jgi:hypothetical protein
MLLVRAAAIMRRKKPHRASHLIDMHPGLSPINAISITIPAASNQMNGQA